MARERQGYRETIGWISERYDHYLLTPEEVAQVTGYSVKYVTQHYVGWTGRAKGKRLPITKLAAQIC